MHYLKVRFITRTDALSFIVELDKAKLAYHFDDDPRNCITRDFSEIEFVALEAKVEEFRNFCDRINLCPFVLLAFIFDDSVTLTLE